MKVFLSHAARQELAEISDWIARDNPERAESFSLELLDRALALGDYPSAYPVLEAFQHRGIRRRGHGDYLILYRILAETVEVVHIVHGARDVSAVLAADEPDL